MANRGTEPPLSIRQTISAPHEDTVIYARNRALNVNIRVDRLPNRSPNGSLMNGVYVHHIRTAFADAGQENTANPLETVLIIASSFTEE